MMQGKSLIKFKKSQSYKIMNLHNFILINIYKIKLILLRDFAKLFKIDSTFIFMYFSRLNKPELLKGN